MKQCEKSGKMEENGKIKTKWEKWKKQKTERKNERNEKNET